MAKTLSHDFTEEDFLALPVLVTHVYKYRESNDPISVQAEARVMMADREETWIEEERLAAIENRRPRHPAPITNLYGFVVKNVLRAEKNCGMTSTFYVDDRKNKHFLHGVVPLDQQVDEIEDEGTQFERSRTAVFDDAFEDMLDILRQGTAEMALNLGIGLNGKKVTQRQAQNILKKVLEHHSGTGDLFYGLNLASKEGEKV